MPKIARFKKRAHQAKHARRTRPAKPRPAAKHSGPAFVIKLRNAHGPKVPMIADLEKLRPAPILTDDPEKALRFTDRSSPYKWLRRHPETKGRFKPAPLA